MDIAGKILTNIKCNGFFFGLLSRNKEKIVKKDESMTFHIQGSHPKSVQTKSYGEINGCCLHWLDFSKDLAFKISFSAIESSDEDEDNDKIWTLFALPMSIENQKKSVVLLDVTDEEYLDMGLTFKVKSKGRKIKLDQTPI